MPTRKLPAPSPATGSSAPNEVLGLDHVVLRVRDLAASIDFYKHVIGARVERQLQVPRIVQLRVGASLLDLVPGRKGRGTTNLDHFALRVARLDVASLALNLARFGIAPGATAERYGSEGYGPSVYFNDPDGNMIELKGPAVRPRIQRRTGRPPALRRG
ncbi:MAG: VOC family protein [Betaproteobacteria bacterium]